MISEHSGARNDNNKQLSGALFTGIEIVKS